MVAPEPPTGPAVRLLIAFDGSETAADAVRGAAHVFPRAHAHVLLVRPPWLASDDASLAPIAMPDAVIATATEEHERASRSRAEELVESGRGLAETVGLEAVGDVREGTTPWRVIANAAREENVDVLVCGSRAQGRLARSLLGSTSSSLLYHAERPVLVLPPDVDDLGGPALIGYDGSDGAGEAVDAAARLLRGRPAIVVNAWRSPLERSYAGQSLALVPLREIGELRQDVEEMIAAHSAEIADEGAARARAAGLDARPLPVEAPDGVWRALATSARSEGAAVIVAGRRGRGAVASTVLGSVSAGLAHNAERPVLIVR